MFVEADGNIYLNIIQTNWSNLSFPLAAQSRIFDAILDSEGKFGGSLLLSMAAWFFSNAYTLRTRHISVGVLFYIWQKWYIHK